MEMHFPSSQTNNSVRLRDTKKPTLYLTHNKFGQNVLLKGGDSVDLTADSDELLSANPILTFSGYFQCNNDTKW